LKSLLKYPVTLFVLLLVGYTQIFAHVYRIDFEYASRTNGADKTHIQASPEKATGIENSYFEEEEDKRNSLKEFSRDHAYAAIFCMDISSSFFQELTSSSYFSEHSSALSLFKFSQFRVLRL
jgi:hypothetical protein